MRFEHQRSLKGVLAGRFLRLLAFCQFAFESVSMLSAYAAILGVGLRRDVG